MTTQSFPQAKTGPVTRFAPSPTGLLHIGHAYAALTAAAAAGANGRFLLRIEDIDAGRCRPDFEHAIYEDLEWLGLAWERPERRQSEHFADYRQALDRLDAQGVIYPCFCTRAEIQREVAAAGEGLLDLLAGGHRRVARGGRGEGAVGGAVLDGLLGVVELEEAELQAGREAVTAADAIEDLEFRILAALAELSVVPENQIGRAHV